jgi:Uma2 family endonuclease
MLFVLPDYQTDTSVRVLREVTPSRVPYRPALRLHPYTYADYKKLSRRDEHGNEIRHELIDGVFYAMAAPKYRHQVVLVELCRQIATYLLGKPCKVIAAPYDVRLFYDEEDGEHENDKHIVQPDISIVCDRKKRAPEGCHGAPDFVTEVLSPANNKREMDVKFGLYQKAGVGEYWLLDPASSTVTAYDFRGGVTKTYTASDFAPLAHFPGLVIDLSLVFADEE